MKLFSTLTSSLITLMAANALAADLYVSASGSDSNPGTQAAPLKTINRADALAAPGTVVHVAPGTYNVSAPGLQNGGVMTNKSGTSSAPIKFVSDVKGGAKIVFSGTGMGWRSKGSYVQISGFEITGSGRIGILSEGANSILSNNFVHDLTVTGGCNGSGGAGLNIYGPGTIVESNVVRNVGVQWLADRSCNTVQGIYSTVPNVKVSNNIISGSPGVGISNWHGATAATIVNNTIFNSKMGIVLGQGDSGATSAGSSNNYVANNIIYSTGWGISELGAIGPNNRYVSNLLYDAGVAWRLQKGTASGTITANPMFVNYQANGTGNYRLQSGSPAIDEGALASAPKTDISGASRPQGAGIDIGAYEFGGASPSPSPAPSPAPSPSPSPSPSPAPAPSPGGVSISVSSTKLTPGQNFTVTVKGANSSDTDDYVALYLASAADSSWSYKGQMKALDGQPLQFVAPMEAGTYNIRYFAASNAQNRMAVSANLTVAAPAPSQAISLSAASLNFGQVRVGQTSSVQTVTIKNVSNSAVTIPAAFVITGEFAFGGTGTCKTGSSYAPGASCTASIVFKPKTVGLRSGSLSIKTSASTEALTVKLSGTGL